MLSRPDVAGEHEIELLGLANEAPKGELVTARVRMNPEVMGGSSTTNYWRSARRAVIAGWCGTGPPASQRGRRPNRLLRAVWWAAPVHLWGGSTPIHLKKLLGEVNPLAAFPASLRIGALAQTPQPGFLTSRRYSEWYPLIRHGWRNAKVEMRHEQRDEVESFAVTCGRYLTAHCVPTSLSCSVRKSLPSTRVVYALTTSIERPGARERNPRPVQAPPALKIGTSEVGIEYRAGHGEAMTKGPCYEFSCGLERPSAVRLTRESSRSW
ncbi:hypothetical protein DFH06DRAFT_1144118 [Mycena polygramma]|nr:hypothetical protein DFH06DRAFT_1144118 [Mycena polygramma]